LSSAPSAICASFASRMAIRRVKSQCAVSFSASLICHTALAMSPITSTCGKYTASTSAERKLMWMTSVPPRTMKNGGFSITSWPMLMIRSAASMARWTKSPDDSAALPRKRGWRSSTTPLPIWVVMNGIPVLSINCLRTLAVILRLAPAPITRIGLRALCSFSTAASMATCSASGRRCRLRGIGRASVCSAAMSSGSSRCTAPGFSSSARRNASRIRAGMLSAEANW